MKMSVTIILIMLPLNFAISWLNAYSVGRVWAESKAIGGWPRITAWAGAVMSAAGFSWCYLVFVSLVAAASLPLRYIQIAQEAGYLLIIFSVLISGAVIWVQSLLTAWRRRDTASVAIAGWNTFAMAENTADAVKTLPEILKDLFSAGADGDSDGEEKLLYFAFLIAALVLSIGVLTTAEIIGHTARKYAQYAKPRMMPESSARAA
jgi:hypothetical protein